MAQDRCRPARWGLVAIAFLGTVLAAHGPALLAAFHRAMIVGAAVAPSRRSALSLRSVRHDRLS